MILLAYRHGLRASEVTGLRVSNSVRALCLDLLVGYSKENTSPILKLFLSRLEELRAPVPDKRN
jgi:hypothetical protein